MVRCYVAAGDRYLKTSALLLTCCPAPLLHVRVHRASRWSIRSRGAACGVVATDMDISGTHNWANANAHVQEHNTTSIAVCVDAPSWCGCALRLCATHLLGSRPRRLVAHAAASALDMPSSLALAWACRIISRRPPSGSFDNAASRAALSLRTCSLVTHGTWEENQHWSAGSGHAP